jgi:anti-sigma factor RsiW
MASIENSNRCKEIFAMLSDYLDLELPAAACKEVEAHLAGCAPCIEFAESLRKTVELCRRYKPKDLPGPLARTARIELQQAYQEMLAARDTGETV